MLLNDSGGRGIRQVWVQVSVKYQFQSHVTVIVSVSPNHWEKKKHYRGFLGRFNLHRVVGGDAECALSCHLTLTKTLEPTFLIMLYDAFCETLSHSKFPASANGNDIMAMISSGHFKSIQIEFFYTTSINLMCFKIIWKKINSITCNIRKITHAKTYKTNNIEGKTVLNMESDEKPLKKNVKNMKNTLKTSTNLGIRIYFLSFKNFQI